MLKLLIDCDPGVDDSIALLFALNHPDITITGISTGMGNVSAKQGAENVLSILKMTGDEHIPVCIGAESPLFGTCDDFPDWIHGKNGLGNVQLSLSDKNPVAMKVEDFLYEKACQFENELTLVTLGRMTNIAKTIQVYPDFPKKIRNLVSMGGSISSIGNVSPVSEANIGGDPEAADIVLQQDLDITMVGLNVTTKTHISLDDIQKLKRLCRPECREMVDFIEKELIYYTNGNRSQSFTMEYSPLHDPLAMIVAVDPSVVTLQKRITRIECQGTYTRGMIVTDMREKPIEGRFVSHCIDVNARKALNILYSVFQ